MTADVIVIGGGPAGSSAAIHLASAGMSVRLYEKARFPRAKLCGGYLSAEALPELARLGLLDPVKAAGAWPIHQVLVSAPSGMQASSELSAPAYSISRHSFDELLLNHARASGVEVIEGEDGSTHRDESPWTVIATGRALSHLRRERTTPFFGLQAFFENVDGVTDQIELDMIPGGYFGLARGEQGFVNVCGLMDQPTLRSAGPDLDHAMRNFAAANPLLKKRLRNARRASPWQAVGPVVMGMRRLVQRPRSDVRRPAPDVGPRTTFFAGDAACVVDPFAGEGMAMGLVTGRLLRQAFDESPASPEQAYERLWHAQFDSSRRLQKAICWAIEKTWWQEFLAHGCRYFPPLMRWLTDNTRPYDFKPNTPLSAV